MYGTWGGGVGSIPISLEKKNYIAYIEPGGWEWDTDTKNLGPSPYFSLVVCDTRVLSPSVYHSWLALLKGRSDI